MSDSGEGKGGDGDGVGLVATEAVSGLTLDPVKKADVVAAGTGHDDGVATLPEQGLGDVDRGAPFGPGGGAVVLRGAAGGGLDAEVTSEAAAPGGLAVVFI